MMAGGGRWWPMVIMGASKPVDWIKTTNEYQPTLQRDFPALNIMIPVYVDSQIVAFQALHTELTPRLRTGLTLVGYTQDSHL
jgi:hypothetical protein